MIRQTLTREATVNADGEAVVRFGPVDSLKTWVVSNISVIVTGTSEDCRATVHIGDEPTDANFFEGTESGVRDSSPQSPLLELYSGSTLIVKWTGAVEGDQARATLRYRQAEG